MDSFTIDAARQSTTASALKQASMDRWMVIPDCCANCGGSAPQLQLKTPRPAIRQTSDATLYLDA
jgi:hypothetical protein